MVEIDRRVLQKIRNLIRYLEENYDLSAGLTYILNDIDGDLETVLNSQPAIPEAEASPVDLPGEQIRPQ